MLHLLIITIGLQVNGWFHFNQVKHLIVPRIHNYLKPGRIEYGDYKAFDAIIAKTKIPEHVIVSCESTRTHYFLHDKQHIRRCLWDGKISTQQKTEIATSVVQFLNQTNTPFELHMFHYQDAMVFNQAILNNFPETNFPET
jgi:hypothetical protein